MQSLAAAAIGILIVTSLVVGARLLALYRRTRALPELLLGGMFLLATGMGFPLRIAAHRASAEWAGALELVADIGVGAGYSLLFVFTWRVFRPHATWAGVLTALGALTLLGAALQGTVGPLDPATSELLFQAGPVLVACLWTACESLRYHGMMRRRVKLGIADVTVSNRFLLWGLMGLSQTFGVAVTMSAAALQADVFANPRILLFSSASGIAQAVIVVLAFVPPGFYLRWVRARGGLAQA